MRAWVAEVDGKVIGVAGVQRRNDAEVAFSDLADGVSPKIFVAGARRFFDLFGDRPLVAFPSIDSSRRVLTKFGFVDRGDQFERLPTPVVPNLDLLKPLQRDAGEAPPFIVYGLPRSRTAWLSKFLTYRDWACRHERAVTMRSFADVRRLFLRPRVGTVETGVSPGWRLIHELVPDIKAVVIHRPVDEVVDSVKAIDVSAVAVYDYDKLRRNLTHMARSLRRIAEQNGVLSVEFSDLDDENTCRKIFEHCLPFGFDRGHWLDLKDRNIQIDVTNHLRYYARHRAEIHAFKRECKTLLRALVRKNKREAAWQVQQ